MATNSWSHAVTLAEDIANGEAVDMPYTNEPDASALDLSLSEVVVNGDQRQATVTVVPETVTVTNDGATWPAGALLAVYVRIPKVVGTANELQQTLADMQSQITKSTNDIAGLTTRLGTAESSISSLDQRVSALESAAP